MITKKLIKLINNERADRTIITPNACALNTSDITCKIYAYDMCPKDYSSCSVMSQDLCVKDYGYCTILVFDLCVKDYSL